MTDTKVRRPLASCPTRTSPGGSETYADGLGQTIFNGRTAHITLTVNRFEPPLLGAH